MQCTLSLLTTGSAELELARSRQLELQGLGSADLNRTLGVYNNRNPKANPKEKAWQLFGLEFQGIYSHIDRGTFLSMRVPKLLQQYKEGDLD